MPEVKGAAAATIQDYDNMREQLQKGLEMYDGAQPGDPEKGVANILDLVTGTGIALNKPPVVRISLGTDSIAHITHECQSNLATIAEWGTFISSTNF